MFLRRSCLKICVFFAAAVFCAPAVILPQDTVPPAARIVSLSPSTTEILYALGAGDQVAGVTTYCVTPPEARLKPKVGGFTNHNLEAIAALKPDLVVLTPNGGSRLTYERLKSAGIPALSVSFYGLSDLEKSFELLGHASGHDEKAAALRTELQTTLEAVKQAAPSGISLRAAYVTWRAPLILAGAGTMEEEIMLFSGAKNSVKESSVRYPRWSEEAFLSSDPDVIFDASAYERDGDPEKEKKAAHDFWVRYKTLRAVRERHVYLIRREFLPVPGPRTVVQIRVIASVLKNLDDEGGKEAGYDRLSF